MGRYCFLETLKTQVNYLALTRASYHVTEATEPEMSSTLRPPRLPPETGALTARRWHMSPGTGASYNRCYHLQRWPDQDSDTLDVNSWVLSRQQGLATLSAVNDMGPLEGLWKGLKFQAQLLPTPLQDLRFFQSFIVGNACPVTKTCCYNRNPENEMSYSRN